MDGGRNSGSLEARLYTLPILHANRVLGKHAGVVGQNNGSDERETLIGLLKRLHENLPQVEVATERYLAERFPRAVRRRRSAPAEPDDGN